jgi:hypothetical protein
METSLSQLTLNFIISLEWWFEVGVSSRLDIELLLQVQKQQEDSAKIVADAIHKRS